MIISSLAVALLQILCDGPGTQANHGRWAQIGQVKEKISMEKGWEAGLQKLIYSGMNPPSRHWSC